MQGGANATGTIGARVVGDVEFRVGTRSRNWDRRKILEMARHTRGRSRVVATWVLGSAYVSPSQDVPKIIGE